jgi:hypothetical protein
MNRTCTKCAEFSNVQDYLWRGLNGYNVIPASNVPYAPMSNECSCCKRVIMTGFEEFSTRFNNGKAEMLCARCSR